jgi:hypothetical protein
VCLSFCHLFVCRCYLEGKEVLAEAKAYTMDGLTDNLAPVPEALTRSGFGDRAGSASCASLA